MKNVYLAGPITGFTYAECTDWRDYARDMLQEEQLIKTWSPMRGKKYLEQLKVIKGVTDEYEHLGPFSTLKGIMSRDFYDCTHADVLLVHLLGAKAVSIGTVAEMAWAYHNRIPTVVAMENEGNPHEHGFVQTFANFRTNSLDEAIDVVKGILL